MTRYRKPSAADEAIAERNRFRAGLANDDGLVTIENFAEMQIRAETAERLVISRDKDISALSRALTTGQEQFETMKLSRDEEKAIVNRIWGMFGNPAYEFLDGKSIYDLVQDGLDAIQLLSRYREGHRQPSGQECYVNLEQGDYRCADCIEADRLTGFERQLRKMNEDRMNRLRESLNSPNNGL